MVRDRNFEIKILDKTIDIFFHKLNVSINVTITSVTIAIFSGPDFILEDFTQASPKEYVYKPLLVCKH